MLAPVLLVLAAAVAPATDTDFVLPPIPLDEAPRPQPIATPPPAAPVTTQPVAMPPSTTSTRTPAPVPVSAAPSTPEPASSARYLVPETSLVDGGFGGTFLRLTGLDGEATVIPGASVDVTRGRFFGGVSFTSGGTDRVGLTTFGLRAGARLATFGLVDVGAGMTLGVGAARSTMGETTERAGVVTWEPELSARVPLLPWLRAQASLGYRLANVGEWSGPAGDALAGMAAGIGLEFGRF